MKGLYNKNLNSLKKETEENTRRWKDFPCSWVIRINIVKITVLLIAFYRFHAILIKIPMMFFIDMEKNPEIYMEPQKTLNAQSNPEQKEQ